MQYIGTLSIDSFGAKDGCAGELVKSRDETAYQSMHICSLSELTFFYFAIYLYFFFNGLQFGFVVKFYLKRTDMYCG